jgi:hypothetical protein
LDFRGFFYLNIINLSGSQLYSDGMAVGVAQCPVLSVDEPKKIGTHSAAKTS